MFFSGNSKKKQQQKEEKEKEAAAVKPQPPSDIPSSNKESLALKESSPPSDSVQSLSRKDNDLENDKAKQNVWDANGSMVDRSPAKECPFFHVLCME